MFFIALIVCALTLAGYFLFFKNPSQSECSNNSNNVEETSSTPVGATAFKTGAIVAEKTTVLTGAAESHEKVPNVDAPKFEDRAATENSCSETLAGGSSQEGHQPAIVVSDKVEECNQSLTSNVQEEVLNISPYETAEDAKVLTTASPLEEEVSDEATAVTPQLQGQQQPAVLISQEAEDLTAPVDDDEVEAVAVTQHLEEQQQQTVDISHAAEDVTPAPAEENNIHSDEEIAVKAQETQSEPESQSENLIQVMSPEPQSEPEPNPESCSVEIRVTEPEPIFQTEILPENEIFQNEIQNEPTKFESNTDCHNRVATESENSKSGTDNIEHSVKFMLGELSQDDFNRTEIENKIINNISCDGEASHLQETLHDVIPPSHITRSAPVKCSSSRSSQNSFSSLSKIVEYECEDLSVTPKNDESHFQNEIDGKVVMNERSDSIDEIVEANTLQIFSDHEKPKLKRQETMYDSAEVVTFVSRMNVCCAIFKNPADHRTHYYRKRFKVPKDEAPIPTELRNIAASFRVWGKHWDRIHHIKICQKSCASLEEPSKAVHRLEDQREDCQNKFGCRISLQDFDTLGTLDKKVLGDLLEKIHNNFVSEDDLAYFNLQDDSEAVDKYYFDL